jgi:hypothetical protein
VNGKRGTDMKALAMAKKYGWSVLDANTLTAALSTNFTTAAYTDDKHFQPFVYTELNDYLLNIIC